METFNFWDYEVWGIVNLVALLVGSLLIANSLKKLIPALEKSLIPSSVLGGLFLLILSLVYEAITGTPLFQTKFFGGNGQATLEILTYHGLALGFIATTFRSEQNNFGKERRIEIFNTGVSTVSMYLIQGLLGLGLTVLIGLFNKDLFSPAGALLPFGYGQGTGQALNYGNIFESEYGFSGGKSFGLTIAALGFLSAALGGVIHLQILKKKDAKYSFKKSETAEELRSEDIQKPNEIPMNGSIDKLTMQIVFIGVAYLLAYGFMILIGTLFPSVRSVVFGCNFLFGVLAAVLIKNINNRLLKKKIVNRQHVNSFLMTRLSGFFFDIMIIAGIAAIRFEVLSSYWPVVLALGIIGLFSTYFYTRFVAKKLFPGYTEEQFMATYGMLTGTASTGIVLLKELDPELKTPAADNLVFQNLPAMLFGFPMMFFPILAASEPEWTLVIVTAAILLMNLILFRKQIFRKKRP